MNSRPLIPALLAFITGILVGNTIYIHIPSIISALFLLMLSLLIISFLKKFSKNIYIFLILFLLTGVQFSSSSHEPSKLLHLSNTQEKIIIEATVISPSMHSIKNTRIEVMVERLLINSHIKIINEKLLVTIYNSEKDFSPGDKIRFPAKLKPIQNFNNPGRYNYKMAMRLKGFFCTASVSDGRLIVPMGKGHLQFPASLLEPIRKPIRDLLTSSLPQRNRSIFQALILGEKQGIDGKIREPFIITGLGHMLAVSGLHIGLVAWLTYGFSCWLLSRSYKLTLKMNITAAAAVITCIPVVAYTFLAGLQVSSQRAMIMSLVYLFSITLGREKEIWSTLAFAAFIVLALDPNALFSISFQLSFLAVIGILWLAPIIYKLFSHPDTSSNKDHFVYRLYRYASGLIAITTAVTIFLLPITSLYFHKISLISIIANLTTIPLLGMWVVPIGLLSAVTVHFSSALADHLLNIGSLGLDMMFSIIQFWAQFDWANIIVVTPNIFEITLYYCLIICIYFFKKWRYAKSGLILVLILIVIDISYWTYQTRLNPHLKITCFDVGQGSSTLIQFPGSERMLIDGGGFSGGSFNVGGMIIAPSLLSLKIRRIDYIVLSHPQSDHMNGLRYIASNFNPREFWFNGDLVNTPSFLELLNIVKCNKIKTTLPYELANSRNIAGVDVKLLHPSSNSINFKVNGKRNNLNNNSLVLKLTYGEKSILFPGDIEKEAEKEIISNIGSNIRSNILLVPHHGSRSSSSINFIKTVNPEISIISSGKGNFFKFPHNEIIQRLNDSGSRIFRTDQMGAIELSLSKDRIDIKTFYFLTESTSLFRASAKTLRGQARLIR